MKENLVINHIDDAQSHYLMFKHNSSLKNSGQFFKSRAVADYMCSFMKEQKQDSIRILDAGSSFGILTLSAAMRRCGYKKTVFRMKQHESY